MAFDGERIIRDLKTLAEADLATQLDAVEALWADVEAITLPDPETYYIGHNPTVLELASSAFPWIAFMFAARDPEGQAEWGYQDQRNRIIIDFFVVADDQATCNLIALRYAEALVALLQSQATAGDYKQVDHEPRVNLSQASRHKKTATADLFTEADVDFIQGGRIEVEFK